MKKLNGTEMKALFLFSIVVPIGLLTTFRLTGVLHEPPTPETVTIDEIMWQMERPTKDILIKEKVQKTYTNEAVSIFITVPIHRYYENAPDAPYWYREGIAFQADVNATAIKGFIASIVIKFSPSEDNSTVYITQTFASYLNVTVARVKGIGTSMGVTYIEAKVSGSPCSLRMPVEWVFNDQNIENNCLRLDAEVTYFNEETYRTIVSPIVLKVLVAPTQGFEE